MWEWNKGVSPLSAWAAKVFIMLKLSASSEIISRSQYARVLFMILTAINSNLKGLVYEY